MIRKTLSKAGHQYFTFLTTQATKKLIAYLNHRLAIGESLSADSPVIAPDSEHSYGRGKNSGKKFLKTNPSLPPDQGRSIQAEVQLETVCAATVL
ncbi:hypothetical protein [Candidatus Nitrosotalea sp. TS]|uniref:hypothetical protein n=1 Tax=Candidatus Nitrosotalea sp. TS TaxID=2341020 RepID=UPI001C49AE72|nr:hypothetical protein [Candidatus Nitrosotalea sp. TS]